MPKASGYDLSRNWFNFCFENPDKISPNHIAIFFFAIEHCNRLGWKEKFGFPTQMAMDAIGIKKHQTYIKYFNEICEWGFFKLVQKSVNQYSANIISLACAYTKNGRALDKAFITHAAKQTQPNGQSTGQSNSSIYKQETINHKQLTKDFLKDEIWKEQFCMAKGISMKELESLQQTFISDLNLKGEEVYNIKKYFTNSFNKGANNILKPEEKKVNI